MILTREQALDSGVSFLQRRFSGSMVQTENHGLIWIDQIDGSGTVYYRPMTCPRQSYEEAKISRGNFFDMLPITACRGELGFVNTPAGAVEVVDRGKRQWVWGACEQRFTLGAAGVRNVSMLTALVCMFMEDAIFPEQFMDNLPIAITRQYIWLPDGQIKDAFGYTIATMDRNDITNLSILSPTLYEELEPELATFQWKLHKGVLQ